MTDTVVIVGGYGVFGTRLSLALAADPGVSVLVAGRSLAAAGQLCSGTRAVPCLLDRNAADLAARLTALAPFVVIDAAGPFQAYGADPNHLARSALQAGAHYLDLSDDAGFTAGITSLNALALGLRRVALSGVSSVPALSSAVVSVLADGIEDIHLIESTILPGNRAPRGLSVIRAILAQAGRPVQMWRGGQAVAVPGWSAVRKLGLAAADRRLTLRPASLIGAPDILLFPQHFAARSVIFRAGLELRLMHYGLALMAWPVRLGLLRSLSPLARPLRAIANLLRPFGSDRGGMRVSVAGLASGQPVRRDWVLIAEAGDGPEIPAIPARVAVRMLQEGALPPGARPCLSELPLDRLEAALGTHDIVTSRTETPSPGLFEAALGANFQRLAPAIRDLHQVMDMRRWSGRAEITRGNSPLSRLVCRMFGFPPAGKDVPVTVTMERRGDAEIWTRSFAGRQFRSIMRLKNARMTERFGPFTFTLELAVRDGVLQFPVTAGRLGPLPLPRALLPASTATERETDGRASFDVALALPFVGPLVRYRGWLDDAGYSRK